MSIQIYAAGWALQNPEFNYFKKFLKNNIERISIKGIIYPKKIPSFIEGIPVLDFEEISTNKIPSSSIIIDFTHKNNKNLQKEIYTFFEKNGLTAIKSSNFLQKIITNDTENLWETPFDGVSFKDLQNLKKTVPLNILDSSFFDIPSYATFSTLKNIFQLSQWENFLDFDNDETLDEVLLETILFTNKIQQSNVYNINSSSVDFLNALLKSQQAQPNDNFIIKINKNSIKLTESNFSFYEKCFNGKISIDDKNSQNSNEFIHLTDNPKYIIEKIKSGDSIRAAVILMRRSILDYYDLINALGTKKYRIALRQPDTQHSNLVALLISE